MEIEVSDNPYDAEPLDTVNIPIIVTLSLVCIITVLLCSSYLLFYKVGDTFIVDASHEEESCAVCQLSVAMDTKERLCGMIKDGEGSIPISLHQQAIKVRTAPHITIIIIVVDITRSLLGMLLRVCWIKLMLLLQKKIIKCY